MKIAYIAAGAGGMYCGSCLRDNTLARELCALGHPTVLIPTYTPLRTEDESGSIGRVFYGGLEVYLAQRFRLLRRPLPFLDRLLSAPLLLKALSAISFSTRPEPLGELAVSVLRGEHGNQRKELDELLRFLEAEVRPSVVHLTNSLFSGLAGPIRRRLGVPVVCSFQGEDLFLEGLPAEHRARAIGLIREASAHIERYVAVSGHAARFMAGYTGIEGSRIDVVPPGLRLDGFPPPPAARGGPGMRGPDPRAPVRPFTIAYLARIAPEKGLAVLVEAFRILRSWGGPPARLLAAGYCDRAGRRYLEEVRGRLAGTGAGGDFHYLGELDRRAKIDFLRRADVLSVPAPFPESMGLYAYEAMAAGVPVVLPALGAFPEIVEGTGGGLLVEPGDPGALAAGIARLRDDPSLREALGRRGAEAVHARFTAREMALGTLRVYEGLAAARSAGGAQAAAARGGSP